MQPLPPIRFRFGDTDDVGTLGGDWWTWDETEIARLRGREMIALEEAVDLPLKVVRRGFRGESTVATMALMWIAMHRAGHSCSWADFNPVVDAVEWEVVPTAPLDSSGEDPAQDSVSSSTPMKESDGS